MTDEVFVGIIDSIADKLFPNRRIESMEAVMEHLEDPATIFSFGQGYFNGDKYQDIVFAFSDLMAANAPLIGDCSMLPYPKKTILYAIRWVMEDYETKREATTDQTLREGYDQMLPTLSYLLTRLARDWHEIDPEDKDAITELGGCDSFPDWALKLKAKYIDDDKASNEAYDVAIQVIKEKVEFEKMHGKSKENGPRTKKELDEEYNDLAKQLKISLETKRNRNSGH